MKTSIHSYIRAAHTSDAAQICDIYNYYISNTCITFEEEPVSVDEMAGRIENVVKDLYWLVYEEDGRILGYAYYTKWRVRSAYKFSVESTVYVDYNCKGRGIGRKLYTALLENAHKQGIHVIIGGIALPNPESVILHEKMGFDKVAQFREVGFKHNQWVDVGYWELMLPR
jgi:L-amino acid N-acyltransferase YncA